MKLKFCRTKALGVYNGPSRFGVKDGDVIEVDKDEGERLKRQFPHNFCAPNGKPVPEPEPGAPPANKGNEFTAELAPDDDEEVEDGEEEE